MTNPKEANQLATQITCESQTAFPKAELLVASPAPASHSFESVPTPLKELRQWVAWHIEQRGDGKTTKPPINPHTGKHASVNDPASWGTFDEAVAAAGSLGLPGVGFVFTAETEVVGIDIDDCRDSATGALTPMAEDVVRRFGSYAEVSPSGSGLHILVQGKLPANLKYPNFEMYNTGRYFTITGNRIGKVNGVILSAGIENRQRVIDGVYRWIKVVQVLDKEQSANPAFAALWRGDISRYDNDHSRADQALCNMLVRLFDYEAKLVDRIFRGSRLMRPKWDEVHSADGLTYGQMTVAKALEGREPPAGSPKQALVHGRTRVRSLEEIMESTEPPPEKVVDGLIEEGGISLLIARQKAGKSMLGLQLAISVANGADFLSCTAPSPGPVLYIDYENRSHILKERGSDFGKGFDVSRVYIANYDSIGERNLGLDDELFQKLKGEVARCQPKLLIIDPLRLATSGDLKDDRAMVKALENVSALFQLNPRMGILLIHHLKKAQNIGKAKPPKLLESPQDWIDSIFGSQALLAHVETIIGLDQLGDGEFALATVARASGTMTLRLTKAPNSERFILDSEANRVEKVSAATKEAFGRLEKTFPEGFSWTEGQNLVGNSTLDRAVRKGREVGLLRQDPHTKRYSWVRDSAEANSDKPKAA